MASQNEIANWALDLLGEGSITDINDTTERAERLLNAWGPVRDAALRARWWRFSIERTTVAADTATPSWGFSKQYTIAGDVVRVIQVDQYWPAPALSDYIGEDHAEFRIEGDKILTDIASPLKVRWIINSVDVGLWDPCFAQVMACDLADRLSTRMTASEAVKNRVKQERFIALSEAARANALEQPPTVIADASWVAVRYSI